MLTWFMARIRFWWWYLLRYRPMAGAEEGDDAGDGGDDDDGGDSGEPEGGTDGLEAAEKERLLKTIENQRRSERELKAKLKELERRDMSDVEKLKSELEEARQAREDLQTELSAMQIELEAQARDQRVRSVAQRYGAYDPDDIALILTEEETEDDRQTERAVKRLQKEKPHLFARRSPSGGTIEPAIPAGGGDMNALIRQAAGRE